MMAARRMFVYDLKRMFTAIYNDFMNEVKIQDPEEWFIEVFDWVNNEIEVDMMISKDGSSMIIQGICNRNVGYMKKGMQWEIKTDKIDYDFLNYLKTSPYCNYDIFGFGKTYPYYYFRFEWADFLEYMIEHCVYFNAGQYGCLEFAKYEKDVKDRFERLCLCSLISRHVHSEVIHPLMGPNMAHLI